MAKILPYPLLSLAIWLMWLLLAGFTAGQALLGAAVALFCGLAMTRLTPRKRHLRRPGLLPLLAGRVAADVVKSNFAVMKIILTGGKSKHPSGFIMVPLRLTNRLAVALLACILTATPGTAWIAYDRRSGRLILHILDLFDESYWQETIKTRYENLLLEIFA